MFTDHGAQIKEEVVRRLKHTSEGLGHSKRMDTLEDLCQRMVNSGHKPKFIRSVLIGGILRFESKMRQSKLEKDSPGYRPLHQPTGRCKDRLKNKAMKKNNWYRNGPRTDVDINQETGVMLKEGKAGKRKRENKRTSQQAGIAKQMIPSTVMFVPNTKGAIMLNKLKEGEIVWSNLTGFRVNYTEAGGTPLINMFNQDTGKGAHCNREVCHPCDTTEENKRQNCKIRSILYETSCKICNPEVKKTSSNPLADQQKRSRLGIYIGESSRSLHERMAEHFDDARKFSNGSHIVKHWMEEHPQMSGDFLLNGKCDYLSNCISRIVVNEDEYCKKKREIKEELEEKERLLKLEEFRREKSGHIKGVKRKTIPAPCMIGKKRKMKNTKPNMYKQPQITSLPHTQSDQLSVEEITPQMLQTGLMDGWNAGVLTNYDKDTDKYDELRDELRDELHNGLTEDVSEITAKTKSDDTLHDGWMIYTRGEPMNKINCLKNDNIPVECDTETIPPDADDNYDDCTGDNADTDAIEDVELNAGLTDDIVGDTLKENNLGKEVQPGLRNESKSIGGTGDHATTDQDDI